MKRRNFITALFGAPVLGVLPLPAMQHRGRRIEGVPLFRVGDAISSEFIDANPGHVFTMAEADCELIPNLAAHEDNWRHWIMVNRAVKLTAFKGWTVWAEWMPAEEHYIVTEVKRI